VRWAPRTIIIVTAFVGIFTLVVIKVNNPKGLDPSIELATSHYRDSYPHIKVERSWARAEDEVTLVSLHAGDWTYRVTVREKAILDDGFAHKEAAAIAAEWARIHGYEIYPINSDYVRSHFEVKQWLRTAFPGAVEVPLSHTRFSPLGRVVVYGGRVVRFYGPDKAVENSHYAIPATIIDHYFETFRASFHQFSPQLTPSEIFYEWDCGDGTVEFGAPDTLEPELKGYVLLRGDTLVAGKRAVPTDEIHPPHLCGRSG
jgi:hypothetical protein